MAKIRIVYFDLQGGRAEPARIALHAAGIPFDDERIPFSEFLRQRDGYPFRCLPVAEIDGQLVTQSNAINRYVGRLTGLYPEDPVQALWCDEVMDANEDILHHVVRTFGLEGDALREAREALAEGWLKTYIEGIGRLLERGGDYFADGRLTIADLKIFVWVRGLRKGSLDHLPPDLVDRLAPNLVAHQERIAGNPIVTGYYGQFRG